MGGVGIVLVLNGLACSTYATPEPIIPQLKSQYKSKVITDHPHIVSSSISVQIINSEILTYPTGSDRFQFDIPEQSDVLGKTILPLQFLNDTDTVVKTVKVYTHVTGKAYYMQTRLPLKRYDVITSDNVTRVLQNASGKSHDTHLSLSDIIGKQLKSTIPTHTILSHRMLQEKQLIRSGQQVGLIIENAGISLRLKGLAMDDGARHQMVRVKVNYQSNQILQGEVINESTVRVPYMY
jgi:flagella basal body P-ring formation protein FlgA